MLFRPTREKGEFGSGDRWSYLASVPACKRQDLCCLSIHPRCGSFLGSKLKNYTLLHNPSQLIDFLCRPSPFRHFEFHYSCLKRLASL
ncbi:unnamed protein product [Arabis nemorensis]|uniref:Uncharacterized protein n=1 Tax=Arabis nemorensis TaxID=586526 RepID=A0A565CCJ1_9BRAS|nr:unnamed protein product [Arabis nemorensis]